MDQLQPKVLAFDANDFKPDGITVAKEGNALIYVDRLGPADTAAIWQQAIDAGADGIQTDHPEALIKYLREKGYRQIRASSDAGLTTAGWDARSSAAHRCL